MQAATSRTVRRLESPAKASESDHQARTLIGMLTVCLPFLANSAPGGDLLPSEAAYTLFGAYLEKAMTEIRPCTDVETWGRCGYASGAHPMAALGLDCVLMERANDDIDVVTVGAASHLLQQYPVLILLGPIPLDASLRRTLQDYVRSGRFHRVPRVVDRHGSYLASPRGAPLLDRRGACLRCASDPL